MFSFFKKPQYKKYGLIRDHLDARDKIYKVAPKTPIKDFVDLRPEMPPVFNQLELGSCSSQAIAAAFMYDHKKQFPNEPLFTPSRLMIYYQERVLEGTVNVDAGAMLRDGIKVINKPGVCDEKYWPYDIKKFAKKPSSNCYLDAPKNIAVSYSRLGTAYDMKVALSNGFPIIFGMSVFESFESEQTAKTGVLPMPGPNESMLGGHAVLCVGFSEKDQHFIIRNSWGSDWGQGGYFIMPYTYMTPQYTSDYWVVTAVK